MLGSNKRHDRSCPRLVAPEPGTELVHLVCEFGQPPVPTNVWNPAFNPEELSMSVKFVPACSIAFGDLKPRLEVEKVLGSQGPIF